MKDAWDNFLFQLGNLWLDIERDASFWIPFAIFVVAVLAALIWAVTLPVHHETLYHICVTHPLKDGSATTVCHDEWR